ncbi:hypothetical protein U1Q18_047971, partial [Sarracenia purpurea var. burkii]
EKAPFGEIYSNGPWRSSREKALERVRSSWYGQSIAYPGANEKARAMEPDDTSIGDPLHRKGFRRTTYGGSSKSNLTIFVDNFPEQMHN